ncbi:FCD domain-containing protein [Maridesulfovibrio salexigens]|uniref:GntR domain protein n=1 Tax=Maridesulfovibrio salexigens (strain ATCC 14822 / DSM 2638 / NCIMB 8403 / VKM B-1763) TaxID=526222 RepID=C6BTC2_MARSD|nr:FCD domain-containing protein [Maridesulfovibrio salexigens]ACS81603.1 GntR domain protein [Maridesulfovibrio salexigens DSM 2638]
MKLSLTPELEKIINGKIETGQYQDGSEVIREALRFMLSHEKFVHKVSNQVDHVEIPLTENINSATDTAEPPSSISPNQFCPDSFFSEYKKRSSVEHVFDHLRENIYRGELKPGELLISAKRIAELMKVSLLSVDEAIKLLVKYGYLEKRKDNEYYVSSVEEHNPLQLFSSVMTPQKSSLDELLEVRLGLETYGVGLAVDRADERDIKFMQEALKELTLGRPDKNKAQEADIKFHMGIAFSTHNLVHIELIRRFYDYMFHSISTLHSLLYEESHNLEIIDQHHYKILDAIIGRDKKSAERYMLQHILFLKSFIKEKNLSRV